MKLTLDVPDGLMLIVNHLAETLGITPEEAAIHFMRSDAMSWYAQVMRRTPGKEPEA